MREVSAPGVPMIDNVGVMKPEHVRQVVAVHLRSFPGFFLTFLGPAFLSELYHGIIADRSGLAYVYQTQEAILGLVAGTDSPTGFYRRLLRQRWWRFAWAAALPVLKKPSIIPRLLRAFSRGNAEDVHEDCATLMSIAVAPEAQGQGVGQALVHAFLREATRRGLAQVNLTTDRLNNEGTNRFYQNLGFAIQQTYTTPEGREMNEYVLDLEQPSGKH